VRRPSASRPPTLLRGVVETALKFVEVEGNSSARVSPAPRTSPARDFRGTMRLVRRGARSCRACWVTGASARRALFVCFLGYPWSARSDGFRAQSLRPCSTLLFRVPRACLGSNGDVRLSGRTQPHAIGGSIPRSGQCPQASRRRPSFPTWLSSPPECPSCVWTNLYQPADVPHLSNLFSRGRVRVVVSDRSCPLHRSATASPRTSAAARAARGATTIIPPGFCLRCSHASI